MVFYFGLRRRIGFYAYVFDLPEQPKSDLYAFLTDLQESLIFIGENMGQPKTLIETNLNILIECSNS